MKLFKTLIFLILASMLIAGLSKADNFNPITIIGLSGQTIAAGADYTSSSYSLLSYPHGSLGVGVTCTAYFTNTAAYLGYQESMDGIYWTASTKGDNPILTNTDGNGIKNLVAITSTTSFATVLTPLVGSIPAANIRFLIINATGGLPLTCYSLKYVQY